jgi:hypothetical protein
MLRARLHAILQTARLTLRAQLARQQERDALIRAGELLATSGHRPPAGACRPVLEEIQRVRAGLDAQSALLSGSLEADRRDYLAVAGWMRPVVILRGWCARAVLRHRLARARRELSPLHRQLAAAALAEPSGASGGLLLPPALADAVRSARAELTALGAERARLLEPFGGQAYPSWVGLAIEELAAFARALVTQARSQILPRSSALAGLAAGWWVTHTYTDSRPRALLRSLGIGGGGTHVVRSETYRGMRFWLPLLAAAVCAYLGDRLARWIEQRYHPRPAHSRDRSPEAMTRLPATT